MNVAAPGQGSAGPYCGHSITTQNSRQDLGSTASPDRLSDPTDQLCHARPRQLGRRKGLLVSMEGLWGAGKSTAGRMLGDRLAAHGFTVQVLHYGPFTGVYEPLTQMLTDQPLRSREGFGGFKVAHHATVDVLLRMCREAYNHQVTYSRALEAADIVVIDHGIYAKFAYGLAVLTESRPGRSSGELLAQLRELTAPWFLHPDIAFYVDTLWPLARERAIARGYGGEPGSVERLLFLPMYDAALRAVARAWPERIRRIPVGLRSAEEIASECEREVLATLLLPTPKEATS